MSNNKQSSSIEWLQAIELERDLTLADWNKAKAMHKEEMVKFALFFSHAQVSRTNVIDEYNETFGGNK